MKNYNYSTLGDRPRAVTLWQTFNLTIASMVLFLSFVAGVMTAFVDKVEVYTVAGASAVAEELSPVVSLESTSSAIKNMDVRRVATWAYRL